MTTVGTHHAVRPLRTLCASLGVAPATYDRAHRRAQHPVREARRRASPRALTPDEQQRVLEVLHAERFIDLAPAQVYAMLLDEGIYHGAERTMSRALAAPPTRASVARSAGVPSTRLRDCSPRGPISCGVGTSPRSKGRPPGRGITGR